MRWQNLREGQAMAESGRSYDVFTFQVQAGGELKVPNGLAQPITIRFFPEGAEPVTVVTTRRAAISLRDALTVEIDNTRGVVPPS
jgi:hypothetical protein